MEISSWFVVVAFLFQFEFYKRRKLVNLSQDLTSGDDTLLVSFSPFPSTFPWRAANEWDEAVKKIRHKAISNMCGLIDGYFITASSEGRGACATPLGRGVLLFPTLCPSMLAGPHFYRIKSRINFSAVAGKSNSLLTSDRHLIQPYSFLVLLVSSSWLKGTSPPL